MGEGAWFASQVIFSHDSDSDSDDGDNVDMMAIDGDDVMVMGDDAKYF